MKGRNAQDIITQAESTHENILKESEDIVRWFIDNQGEIYNRNRVASYISEQHNISKERANMAIVGLIDDVVDPVQQINVPSDDKYVGVIGYEEYPSWGAYRYIDYHDVFGKRQRIVCSRCVNTSVMDSQVRHATQGEGSVPCNASVSEMLDKIEQHYEAEHNIIPEEINVGASLVSGTTIDGNTAFHAGNDGSGSNLDADTVDGNEAADIGAPSNTQNASVSTGLTTAGVDLPVDGVFSIINSITATNNAGSTFDLILTYVDSDSQDNFSFSPGETRTVSIRDDVVRRIAANDPDLIVEEIDVVTVPTHNHSL